MSKISVVMCTCNGAAFIREQIESILSQTYPIFEFIIQDDCSSDTTAEIADEYAQKYPFIRIIRNQKNMGVTKNFFSALSKATGDYIAISDQDDIWHKDKLERQINFIGDNLLCAGLSNMFSGDGSLIDTDMRKRNISLLRMLYVGVMAGHTFLLSRKLLDSIPDVNELAEHRCYDIILLMYAASINGFTFMNESLVDFRRHSNAVSYTPPTNANYTLLNIARHAINSIRWYCELLPMIRMRAGCNLRFLEHISYDSVQLKNAITMCRLQSSSSLFDYLIRLSFFCARHSNELFFAESQKRGIKQYLRGLTFPIYCSEYFRGYSKRHK